MHTIAMDIPTRKMKSIPHALYTGRSTIGANAYPKNLVPLNTDATVPRISGMTSTDTVSSEAQIAAVPHPKRKSRRTNA